MKKYTTTKIIEGSTWYFLTDDPISPTSKKTETYIPDYKLQRRHMTFNFSSYDFTYCEYSVLKCGNVICVDDCFYWIGGDMQKAYLIVHNDDYSHIWVSNIYKRLYSNEMYKKVTKYLNDFKFMFACTGNKD